MQHVSFGSILREARIKKGFDISTAARRLQIRADILQAIEDGDFGHMPPSGYTRNMVKAYARLLGLDGSEITQMYLNELYGYGVSQERGRLDDASAQRRAPYASATGSTTGFNRVSNKRPERKTGETYVNNFGRVTYSLGTDDMISGGVNRTTAARMEHQQKAESLTTPHRARRSANVGESYYNAVEGRSGAPSFDFRRILPFLLGAAIVVVVLFLVLNLTVCHQSEPAETIPVTSETTESADSATDDTSTSTSDSSSASDSEETTTEVEPTEFTLSYEVESGSTSYIEVKVDGKYVTSADVTGPKTETFTSSDSISFVATQISGVTLTIDGEKQKLKENSSGIYQKTFKFKSILKTWKKNHKSSSSNSSSKSSSSNSGSTSSTSSSAKDTSDSSSNTSSGSTSSSSASSDSGSSDETSGTLSVTGASED